MSYRPTCGLSAKEFKCEENLRRHQLTHEPNSYLKKTYTCDLCQKSFIWKDNLKIHLLTHESNIDLKYPFACDLCPKKYTRKHNLETHMSTHGFNCYPRNTFTCDLCQKSYTCKASLEKHIIWTHESDTELRYQYTFTCDLCPKKYTRKHNLKIHHQLTHESNSYLKKTHTCDLCQKSFTQKGDLNRHLLTHESNIDLKYAFACDICPKKYTRKHNLEKHMSTHGFNCYPKKTYRPMYNCDLCHKNYTRKAALRRHIIRTHESRYTFTSDLNSKTFIHKENSQKHKSTCRFKSHSKNTYICALCEKNCSSKVNLKKHILAHESNSNLKHAHCVPDLCPGTNSKEYSKIHETGDLQLKKLVSTLKTDPNLKPTAFIRDLCQKLFIHKAGLRKHILTHNPEPDLLTTNFDSSQVKLSGKIDAPTHMSNLLENVSNLDLNYDLENLFTCSVCQREFMQFDVLMNHMLTHG